MTVSDVDLPCAFCLRLSEVSSQQASATRNAGAGLGSGSRWNRGRPVAPNFEANTERREHALAVKESELPATHGGLQALSFNGQLLFLLGFAPQSVCSTRAPVGRTFGFTTANHQSRHLREMSGPDIFISNGSCFYAAGREADQSFLPCGNWAFGHVHCCSAGEMCLGNNACYSDRFGTTYLAGCSDFHYKHENCPDKKSYRGTGVL